ncbi:acetyl-CoA synthetase-like protein [Nemania abortiva]|nr:acetyl-CoA synthetase-like protein [Nemania abortiva]
MAHEKGASYGRRLLPVVLDGIAEMNPNRLYAAIPKTSNVADGFRDVTVGEIARCVNFTANWIEQKLGRSDTFETLTYIGIPDLRGPIVFFAAVKCGYKLLLPSPRNPPATNISLMSQSASNKLLHAVEVAPIVSQIRDREPSTQAHAVPSFDEMVASSPKQHSYQATFEDAQNRPIALLHSSGSTGLPKIVTMTHGSFATFDNEVNLPSPPGRTKSDSTMWQFDGEARVYTVFPFFHLGGFLFFTVNAIFRNASPVLGPPHMIPDGPLVRGIMAQQKIRAMFLVPSIIEQLLQEPNGINLFNDVDFIAYSGAPSSAAVGDRISTVVRLVSPFGSTEIFQVPQLLLPREDWAWHEFNPYYKHEMQPYDSDNNIFELVILADESTKDTTAMYHNLPGISEYRTKDLFVQHPTRPSLFRYYGRRDDIIVLANGEKFNPIPFEVNMQGHPSVKGALMVGNGRSQVALLVEPKEPVDGGSQNSFFDDIWPLIQESNALVPGQGRISRDKVICGMQDKPFIRTGKGTIIRRLTEQAYQDQIERLYLSASDEQVSSRVSKLTFKRVYQGPEVTSFLRNILAMSFVHGATIGENEDFYSHGLDSVQTLEIAANLRRHLQGESDNPTSWISPRTIYRNHTLKDLSRVVIDFLQEGLIPEEDHRITRARMMDETVLRYTKTLPSRAVSKHRQTQNSQPSTVALIGSTGYLGSYTLLNLLKTPSIKRVFCLNRRGDADEKQSVSLRNIDESIDPLLAKIVYMTIKLGQPFLGLTKAEFELVSREADVVVYNSWRLDFGLSIGSFEPFLSATRDLVDLSRGSARNMRIVYVSSISSVSGISTQTTAPEAPVEDALAALDIGYAESKLAAERILVTANRQICVPVSIVRVCQVGGPADENAGSWAEQPWLSALLRTSKTLGCVPTDVAPIDWVPVDTIAAIMKDVITAPSHEEIQVFNLYPPKPPSWQLLVDILRETYGIREAIPMKEWTRKLRSIPNPNGRDVAEMPALKILDYYEVLGSQTGLPTFETDHLRRISGVEFPTIDHAIMKRWLRDWNL